jgi:hypothetical protein
MERTANKRIATKAYAFDKARKRNFGMDKGGGSGRIGTRSHAQAMESKNDRLRPEAA